MYNSKMTPISIPDEIVLSIASFASATTVLSMQKVSRNFYNCLTPAIYHSIFYTEPSSKSYKSNFLLSSWPYYSMVYFNPGRGQVLCTASKVYNIRLLLRTVKESEALRHLVHVAGFELAPKSPSDLRLAVREIITLVRPTLQCLHCAPGNFDFGSWIDMPIQSLQLDIFGTEDRDFPIRALNAMNFPSGVERFTLAGVRNWSLVYRNIVPLDPLKQFFKGIKCLSFPYSVSLGCHLQELLEWPDSLQSFYLEAVVAADASLCGRYSGNMTNPTTGLSAKEFAEALYPQRHSLEEIFIFAEMDSTNSDQSTMRPLHEFVNLKKLGVRSDWIRRPDEEDEYAASDDEDFEINKTAITELPLALEELQLQYEHGSIDHDPEVSWVETFKETHPPWALIGDIIVQPGEINRLLCDIASIKTKQCPHLRRVFLWNPAYGRNSGYGPNWSVPRFVDVTVLDACAEFSAAFRNAGIEFRWFVEGAPPLFSEWKESDWINVTKEWEKDIVESGLEVNMDVFKNYGMTGL